MINAIISWSTRNKLVVLVMTAGMIAWGLYSLTRVSIGAVPDVTNNQVQVITTSRNLSTQDIEQFITYPIELEMANLPGVIEIRSISKFGLSVVTVVFEDEMGTYLPRQLISEKLRSAQQVIPADFGTPQVGPITTGLGEIYQYTLEVEPAFEGKYTPMDLRTIQDWVVKRQLSGIPGVVEINTWGGYLKQYEVAVELDRLNSLGVSIGEVYDALQKNNDVAGGGYIEKYEASYFIRGEGLVNTFKDIENIVVASRSGVPVYIKDVAKVQYGYATRFGAITGNGEGEKVLGQVMMLKDASSDQVIKAVKKRVEEISATLPEGVYINAFLDRSELIAKTTFTVVENLLLGALIVVIVVVLILGDVRAGLIVASVIPLALLFTLSMMNVFGVDANLMSLGAIDFGIIIDGAVIIVEFVVFKFTREQAKLDSLEAKELRSYKDSLTVASTSKMMRTAIFGQVIILLVFIPVLSLEGIEGKMFRPMAISFSFAIVGAIILCFTYIPVMASIFARPHHPTDHSLPGKVMSFFNRAYEPLLALALRWKLWVLSLAAVLLGASSYVFFTIGGEFVPTLDEGDYVVQPVIKTGTSLGKTVEISTQIEQVLLDNFPEVSQVVTRIGAAEVPTDPMSMEETDVIIKLKPKNEWVSARAKDELADKMKVAMSVIPGLDFEFTQPIEMRFNELITGVRADVAVKIYGEDLDELYRLANRVSELIEPVEGAADIVVEKIVGLPQMKVEYDRARIAEYGLNIKDVNEVIQTAYGGRTAGVVFEGEKRFDLVVRLATAYRDDLDNLQTLFIEAPAGRVPLKELAKVTYSTGPSKISRDDTRRRVVVGINVRNRDLQSLVDEVRQVIAKNLQLPYGYYIKYGGQFENLEAAKKRLTVVVPVALALIFTLLYFTFNSLKQALLVFSAIPLASIGGILMLWWRGMPFSISAGVGFIALFGIAVLNGIVLIDFFNELEKKGVKDIEERVKQGTRQRLRPVLLTASAAALGFVPMAFSTSAGAEVQRPLATVVIGGLMTATLLTLIVLPVLYTLFPKGKPSAP